MKNIRILGIFLFILGIFAPQIGRCAITKCIKLNSASKCDGPQRLGQASWSATCDNASVEGVAICSSTPGTTNQFKASIYRSQNIQDNIYCWCKMGVPAVSKFIYIGQYDANGCADICSSSCASNIINNGQFRMALTISVIG